MYDDTIIRRVDYSHYASDDFFFFFLGESVPLAAAALASFLAFFLAFFSSSVSCAKNT